jgi:hypothetical protein
MEAPAIMPLAHEKWFVDDAATFPADWGFFFEPPTLILVAVAVTVALLWRWMAVRFLPLPELGFLRPLARLGPWIPRILGIHLGVSLLSLAVDNAYLAPQLVVPEGAGGVLLVLAEGVIGVWLISGVFLRPAAIGVILLGPLGLVLAGPVEVLEACDLLGLALFLVILPPGRNGWGRVDVSPRVEIAALYCLRVLLGAALIVLAFSEKLANPELARQFLDDYPAFNIFEAVGIDLAPENFIRIAGAVELLFGLLLISGAAPQLTVLIAGIPFNTTLFFLGRVELIGHLPIYGAMLALLVYGSSSEHARMVRELWPLGNLRTRRAVTRPAGP